MHKDNAFCINGIEIDLKELEELEQRVAAKKNQQQAQSTSKSDILFENFEKSLKISDQNIAAVCEQTAVTHPPPLASMFLVIMSVFSILNQIYYIPTAQRS